MKAIILAAGKATRVRPLSLTKPKHLFKLLGKTILEHNLDQLKGITKEVILVVGYKGKMIKKHIGNNYKGIKIKYVWQKKQLGTGQAAALGAKYVRDRFLLLMGDDFYSKEDIEGLMKKFPAISVKRVKNPKSFGIIEERKGRVVGFVEKPKQPQSNLANTALYFLPKEIFNYKLKKSERGEYEFTDYIREFIEKERLFIAIAKDWIPISYSWDLLKLAEVLLRRTTPEIRGKIERNVSIKGRVTIGKGTIVKENSRLYGPVYVGRDSVVGLSCTVGPKVVIEDGCFLEPEVSIRGSLIGDNTRVGKSSKIRDSVIAGGCNLGSETVIVNSREDKKTVKTRLNGKLVDTKRKKMGAIIGEGVKIGIRTLIYPGKKIWPRKKIPAGKKITKDLK